MRKTYFFWVLSKLCDKVFPYQNESKNPYLIQFNMNSTVESQKCTCLYNRKQTCTYDHETFSPHHKKIYDDVLDAIGNTPMIKLNKIGKEEGVQCQLLAKCQFMNMGGSIKDRITKKMVIDAEKSGILKPGCKMVEASSGNTGCALSLVASVKGYDLTVLMSEKMSAEKANLIKGLGSNLIRTPSQAGFNDPRSHWSLSAQLQKQGYVHLNQYANLSNPLAYYDHLAEEILYQCDGNFDALIVGVGTGGTLTGLSKKIKQKNPNAIIIGVDPYGSIMALPESINEGKYPMNKIQGIGHDFIPKTLFQQSADQWIKTTDHQSFTYARKLLRQEGLLIGGSSGAVISGALRFIKQKGWENDSSKRIVCVFVDSIRNYLTKFLSSEWCVENGFLPYEELREQNHIFNGIRINSLNLPDIQTFENLTVKQAKELFKSGWKIIPLTRNNQIYAAIFPKRFVQLVNSQKLTSSDSAAKTLTNDFVLVPSSLDVAQLTKLLTRNDAVLVETRNSENKRERLQVATAMDTLDLLD